MSYVKIAILLAALVVAAGPELGTSEHVIRIAVVNDFERFSDEGVNTELATAAIMDAVDSLFQSGSAVWGSDLPIRVVVVQQLTSTVEDPFPLVLNPTTSQLEPASSLAALQAWAGGTTPLASNHAVILLSGHEFDGTLVGLATEETLCAPGPPAAIVQTKGFNQAFVASQIARQIGHLLGMQDDVAGGSIMSAAANPASPATTWSSASAASLRAFIESGQATCLTSESEDPAPTIGVSPMSFSFSATAGGADPTSQTLNITNTGGGTLNFTASDDAPWLSLSPTSGTAPGSVTVSVSIAGLAAGTYNGTITIAGTGSTNSPVPVPVTLTVAAAPAPTIGVSPTSFSFSATAGGANPPNQALNITNTGTGTLNFTASDDAPWLTLSPTSGTAPGSVTVSVSIVGLAAGTYNGTITISGTGATNSPVPVPVTLTVDAAPAPTIGVSPTSFSFSATAGGANPPNQALNITNTGGGTLTFTASDDAPWLTLSPTSGTAPGSVTVSVSIAGLAAGTYNGTITISGTGATNSPVPVPVTLTIGAPSLPGVVATAAGPTSIWLGLKNSDDVGTKFDVLVEMLKNGVVVGFGQVNGVPGGSSGFNNAVQRTIDVALGETTTFNSGDTLGVRLSVRVASTGHKSGTARLWYNDAAANSRFTMVVNGDVNTLYLTSGFALSPTVGTGPKATVDVSVNRSGGNPFKPFGTWTRVF